MAIARKIADYFKQPILACHEGCQAKENKNFSDHINRQTTGRQSFTRLPETFCVTTCHSWSATKDRAQVAFSLTTKGLRLKLPHVHTQGSHRKIYGVTAQNLVTQG